MSNTAHDRAFDSAEAFAGQFLAATNHGALCLMASVGHRTGLFDAMRGLPPSTSAEVARKAGLNERYVREWLGAMVTAGVVEIDADGTKYVLPAEHAALLTRTAGADDIALATQYIAVLAGVEDDTVECFRKGGGVPYSKYPRIHTVMAEDSGTTVLSSLESHLLASRSTSRRTTACGTRLTPRCSAPREGAGGWIVARDRGCGPRGNAPRCTQSVAPGGRCRSSCPAAATIR